MKMVRLFPDDFEIFVSKVAIFTTVFIGYLVYCFSNVSPYLIHPKMSYRIIS